MFLTEADIICGIRRAAKGRAKRPDFLEYIEDVGATARSMLRDIEDGSYIQKLSYKPLRKRNNNGKVRDILQPSSYTLIMQHTAIALLQPLYDSADVHVGLNCKRGCGINSKRQSSSVIHRLKHIFYDMRQYTHAIIIDQRQCYAHIRRRTARRALKRIGVYGALNDFVLAVSFYNGTFPIGTPTSPLLHHIIMLPTDRLLRELSPRACVRYADDIFAAFESATDAQVAKWRIKNLWWYTLGIRAKRHTVRITPLSLPTDYCGNVFYRNPARRVTDHDKGYTRLRESIANSARHSTNKSYPSYFGLIKSTDGFNLLIQIEQANMDLRKLSEKLKIKPAISAPIVDVKTLYENQTEFTIEKYDLRRDKDGKPNWIRCLITYKDEDFETETEVHEIAGSLSYVAEFIGLAEALHGKSLLPLEHCQIERHGNYFYLKGTLQMIIGKDADGNYITN